MAETAAASGATVAVAVSGDRSRRALLWAAENIIPHVRRVVLLHVVPSLSSIPTPSGERIPVEKLSGDVVEMYEQDRKSEAQQTLLPFKKLCRTKKEVEVLVLDGENPAAVLSRYMSESGAENLVLGASSWSWLTRMLKAPDVPTTILKSALGSCNIFVVSRRKLVIKLADQPVINGSCSTSQIQTKRRSMFTQRERSHIFDKQISECSSISLKSDTSTNSDASPAHSRAKKDGYTPANSHEISQSVSVLSLRREDHNHHNLSDSSEEKKTFNNHDFLASFKDSPLTIKHPKSLDEDPDEVERLRLELQETLAMYNQACEDLIYARQKVQLLSAECSQEARKVKDALQREEVLKRIAAVEKSKHVEAVKEVEEARKLLAKEALDRHKAEIAAIKESSEKLKIVDALFSSDKRYRRYSKKEIEVATDNFSDAKKIGEGGYGNVYKCNIDHTPVAVKVLREETIEKKEEFLREVEVLSQLRHPHMLLLLGVCPDSGCLIYEYMENGSLEDRLFCRNGTQPLPWFIRFQIIFEVACGLAFLHGSKPEPIVHRDLKPGNILLDRYYVSKIGDVGLAKLMSTVVPDGVTEYRDTVLAGTFFYMDPEYQRTGTLRPKSDLYAFGIIVLQLLTAKPPSGLIVTVENAIKSSSFANILDKSISDWPLAESERLAQLALKCSGLRCRDRPDLETEVIPELEEISKMTDIFSKLRLHNANAPTHYFCPILKGLMDNPYIAADGFTYEYRAIKAWLEKYNISPVTKLRLQHNSIIPNLSLRSAIEEWKSQAALETT